MIESQGSYEPGPGPPLGNNSEVGKGAWGLHMWLVTFSIISFFSLVESKL